MSFWTVLGCAALGVGAIAAAPFTGGGSLLGAATLAGSLAGTATVAAAVGAGVAGAAVGASMGNDDTAHSEGYSKGQKDAKAKYDVKVTQLEERLQQAIVKLKESGKFFNAIIAMEAVAISVANCDGEICSAEREQIEMFISGLSQEAIPISVKSRIQDIYENPMSIKEAFSLAKESGVEMDVFDEIVQVVINADGVIHSKENAFMQGWNTLRAA